MCSIVSKSSPFLAVALVFLISPGSWALSQQHNRFSRRKVLSHWWAFAPCILPFSSQALTPEEASRDYDDYAAYYDVLDGGVASSKLGIDEARMLMVSKAKGDVLEIGVGTGLNLDRYRQEQLGSLTILDISEAMLNEARLRLEKNGPLKKKTRAIRADATRDLATLFDLERFDTVLDSFSLCVMGNEGALQCLDQMSKVTKKGGKVLLLENSRSSNQILGAYQDMTADTAAKMGGKGCMYNQDVRKFINATPSLQIEEEVLFSAGIFRLYVCLKI